MVFKTKIKADILKRFININITLVGDAKLKITPKEMSLKAVDPAHVAMVDINIEKAAFEEYKADEMDLGIDINKFNDVLKLASPGDFIALEYDEKSNRLIVKIGNLVRRMGLLDTKEMPDSKIPSLSLPAKIVMEAAELRKGICASEMISDYLALIINRDGFELYATGDSDTVSLKLTKDLLTELRSEGKFKSLYAIDYFSNIIKTAKDDELITILMGNDNPMQLDFDFANKNGHVTYLLAPRIEAE